MFDIIIVGGGAAGFYSAIHLCEKNPNLKVAILERGKKVLSKVKVSGGGRCNVTHAAFLPQDLVKNYPRGAKELLGPFHKYASGDVVNFFETRGVPLKIEEDGRIFPVSDSSQTIIDCLVGETKQKGITIIKNCSVKDFAPDEGGGWHVISADKRYSCKKLLLATGSNPKIWQKLDQLGHTIIDPIPSLFTFNIDDERIKGIQGISTNASVEVPPKKRYDSKIVIPLKSEVGQEPVLQTEGPILITHWGLSGPAILKLSAWGARILNTYRYDFKVMVNWVPDYTTGMIKGLLLEVKEVEAKKTIFKTKAVDLPNRLWYNLVKAANISREVRWADASKAMIQDLALQLTQCTFRVTGKSTFKEEFVTAGGVDLKEINFKTFESKVLPGLYFAGEIINVDAITGGFNFQNAWTGAYIAAQDMASN